MNKTYTKAEREHLARIKDMDCAVCESKAPNEAHHIRQDSAYYCVPLCVSCHRDGRNGIHGRKAMWQVYKMDELDALARTISNL